jgi:hypothetical protein
VLERNRQSKVTSTILEEKANVFVFFAHSNEGTTLQGQRHCHKEEKNEQSSRWQQKLAVKLAALNGVQAEQCLYSLNPRLMALVLDNSQL